VSEVKDTRRLPRASAPSWALHIKSREFRPGLLAGPQKHAEHKGSGAKILIVLIYGNCGSFKHRSKNGKRDSLSTPLPDYPCCCQFQLTFPTALNC